MPETEWYNTGDQVNSVSCFIVSTLRAVGPPLTSGAQYALTTGTTPGVIWPAHSSDTPASSTLQPRMITISQMKISGTETARCRRLLNQFRRLVSYPEAIRAHLKKRWMCSVRILVGFPYFHTIQPSRFLYVLECGRWNLSENVANVLVGGVNDLESGSRWPSVAVLFNVKRKASCTVSIFSPKWLITSHSCVQSKSLNPLEWVVFGGPSGYNPTASESAQIKIVKNIVSHPNAKYGQHLVTNDIALIEVHDALKLNTLVNAICLARNQIEDRQLCVTAGWTSSSEGGRRRIINISELLYFLAGISFNQYLTYLPVPTVPLSECNSTAKYNGHLTNSMFCSKSNGDSRVCHVSSLVTPHQILTISHVFRLMRDPR